MEVPFTRPFLRGDEGAAVAEVIASGWVSQGPRVREFEGAFARRVGVQCPVRLIIVLKGKTGYLAFLGPAQN